MPSQPADVDVDVLVVLVDVEVLVRRRVGATKATQGTKLWAHESFFFLVSAQMRKLVFGSAELLSAA